MVLTKDHLHISITAYMQDIKQKNPNAKILVMYKIVVILYSCLWKWSDKEFW